MKILDCTLRDGGYYTNWDFSERITDSYFNAMNVLPVDYVEIGYRSKSYPEYLGKYFYCPDFVIENALRKMPNKKLAIMLNERDVTPDDLPFLLNSCLGKIELIRLAVDPNKLSRAIVLAGKIKSMGFKVAINLMYMSKIANDQNVLSEIGKIKDEIDFLNLVDSYGGVYPEQVEDIFRFCKGITDIPLGFHGHNNMELAFANTLTAIKVGCEIVDSTITGMGRGAGNLRTELFLTWLANKNHVSVDFNELADTVALFEEMKEKFGWGTNLPYMVSGANSLPQKDVMDWVGKRYFSINSIIQALENQKAGIKDNIKLGLFKPEISNLKKAVIVGGGNTAIEHFEAIKQFIIHSENICIIHASSKNAAPFTSLNVQQFFCLVGNEGKRFEKAIADIEIIKYTCVLPEYPRKMGTYIPERAKNNCFELEKVTFTDQFNDSHTALSIQVALDLGIEEIYVAGYDGYSTPTTTQREQELFIENSTLFSKAEPLFKVFSTITPTRYKFNRSDSIYKLIGEK